MRKARLVLNNKPIEEILKTMQLVFLVFAVVASIVSSTLSAPPNRSSDHDVKSLEKAIFKEINAYRVGKGLAELGWNDRIGAQARAHSIAMARGEQQFGHGGFSRRVKATGLQFRAAAENVGQNQGFDDPADQAVEGWLHSPGHRTNIEGQYNVTGVGVARARNGTFFFTQIFMLVPKKR